MQKDALNALSRSQVLPRAPEGGLLHCSHLSGLPSGHCYCRPRLSAVCRSPGETAREGRRQRLSWTAVAAPWPLRLLLFDTTSLKSDSRVVVFLYSGHSC